MPLQVEIAAEPGLHEMLAGEQPVDQNRLLDALNDFVSTTGVAGTAVEDEIRTEVHERAQDPTEALGWWDALKRWSRGEKEVVVGTVQQEVDLAAYWLTLPDLATAKASLTSSTSKENETSASVKIAGVGGGPTFTISLKESVKFDFTQTERAVLTCPGTFNKIEVRRDGTTIGTHLRLAALDKHSVGWRRDLAEAPDPSSWGEPRETRPFGVAKGSGGTTRNVEITEGTTWEVSAEFEVPQFGLKVGPSTKVTYEREVAYEHELPKGHDYIARLYRQIPAWLWTVR